MSGRAPDSPARPRSRPRADDGESLFERQQRGAPQAYTAALLADLLGIPQAAVRHWIRVGLIVPARRERGAAWFDYPQVVAARRLAEFLAAGMSLREIDAAVAAFTPAGSATPLDRLVIVGRRIRVSDRGRLLGPGGQLDLPFDSVDGHPGGDAAHFPPSIPLARHRTDEPSPRQPDGPAAAAGATLREHDGEVDELLALAADLEAGGEMEEAADVLRAVLQASGPNVEIGFALAELLFRAGDLGAARERYHATIESAPEHVEARLGLGRVLAALGEGELALAAFDDVIARAPDYPDAQFHAAAVLRSLGRPGPAARRLRAFLDLTPDGPWATLARRWLADDGPRDPEPPRRPG